MWLYNKREKKKSLYPHIYSMYLCVSVSCCGFLRCTIWNVDMSYMHTPWFCMGLFALSKLIFLAVPLPMYPLWGQRRLNEFEWFRLVLTLSDDDSQVWEINHRGALRDNALLLYVCKLVFSLIKMFHRTMQKKLPAIYVVATIICLSFVR